MCQVRENIRLKEYLIMCIMLWHTRMINLQGEGGDNAMRVSSSEQNIILHPCIIVLIMSIFESVTQNIFFNHLTSDSSFMSFGVVAYFHFNMLS